MEHPEVFDSKFSFLFEPIKDLAKNFNIDLNHHLDEYLNQLENDDVVVKNGPINFVEAALILRGSAAVYSKKVDYLYNLTLKILETLTGNQQNKKTPVEEELDEDVGPLELQNMSMLDNINLSKNLTCREDADETTLSTVMPLSLQGQKVSNQSSEDNKMESESDRKNFTLNNCKIFNSTLILNYLEMKPLLLSLDDDDDNDGQDEIQNDRHTSRRSYTCGIEEICEPVITEDWPEILIENFETDYDHHMDIEEDPKEASPLKIQKIARGGKQAKALKLLDPYENEHEQFVKSAKTGRTFRFPRSLSKKGKVKKYPSAIKSFVENFKEGHSRLGDQVSNGSTVEKEFEDLFIKKVSVKGDKIRTEECVEDHETHGVENNDNGYDAIYHYDDIDMGIQDDVDYQINGFPEEGVYTVENVESYEEAMKHHLAQFFDSANKYKVTSELSQRVGEWESKITKALENEGKMRLYDVHKYSEELIQQLENSGGSEAPVSFSSLVADKDQVDVCRMFMSALHLANHHNIQIVNNQEPDSFLLKLLSKDLHSDELDHFTT